MNYYSVLQEVTTVCSNMRVLIKMESCHRQDQHFLTENSTVPPEKYVLILSCKLLQFLWLVNIRLNDLASVWADHCHSVFRLRLPLYKSIVGGSIMTGEELVLFFLF